jgi:hypothetical protein
VRYGEPAALTVTAAGTEPMAYAWYKNSIVIQGANASTLAFASTIKADEGNYHCVVSNAVGSVTSASARITVTPPDVDGVVEAHFANGADGFIYVDDAFNGTNQPAYADGSHDPAGGLIGGGLVVTLGGVDDAAIDGMSGGWRREFTLNQAEEITVAFIVRMTQTADYEPDETSRLLAEVDGVPLPGQGPDYILQISGDGDGGAPSTTGWRLYSLNIGTLGPGVHTLTIGGLNNRKDAMNESTAIQIDDVWVIADIVNFPPEIVEHPVTRVFQPGERIVLTVEALGTAPFLYQWRKDGINVVGQNGPALIIDPAQTSDAAGYDCVIINRAGSATSRKAFLVPGNQTRVKIPWWIYK